MNRHFKNRRTCLHVVGTDPAQDVRLRGVDGNPRVPVLPTQSPNGILTPGLFDAPGDLVSTED